MAYSFLKVIDMANGKTIYRPIRLCSSYSVSNYYLTPMTFDTIFSDLTSPTTGCTISLGLPSKSEYLKAPNNYYSGWVYGIVKKHSYKIFVKNSDNEDEEIPYIFEFAIARGWITQETVQAGTDSPKYYIQKCHVVSLFRVKDSNNNDVTQEIFGDSTSFPYEKSPWTGDYSPIIFYPKTWYKFSNLLYTQGIQSYDPSEGSNTSDVCYATLTNINMILNVYGCYDEDSSQYFLTLSVNPDGFLSPYNCNWNNYINTYTQYNVNGVAVNLANFDDFSIQPRTMRTLYFDEGYNPIYDSDDDISSGNDDEDTDIQSTGDNATNYGHGIGEDSTEYIDFPSLTTDNPATASGLYRIVKLDEDGLSDLAAFLWSTDVIDTLVKVFSKPFDCIVSLLTLPYDVTASSSSTELTILDYSTGVNVYKGVYAAESVSFGTCDCNESFGNFLDYDNTKVSIFLPYIGMQPLDVQDVMDSILTLVYNIDNQNGQCVAMLKCTKNNMDVDSVTYSWSGNLATQLPLNGVDNTQYLQGLINSVASVAMGNVGGSITGSVNTILMGDKSIMKSGRLDCNTGNLGIMYPYIKVERPVWTRPDNYAELHGLPYDANNSISNMSGLIKFNVINIESSTATETEKDKIKEFLTEGIII